MNRAIALIGLGHRIVIDHAKSQTGAIKVLTVIVDALEEVIPVLEAVAQVCEGSLLDTSDPRLGTAVEVSRDPFRRSAVEKSFSGDDSRRIELTVDNGIGNASFPEVPDGGSSVGQEMVLALVRAMVHRDLDDHPLGILTFSENRIDYPFRRTIWKLINDHLREMPSTTLKTLIVVAESSIDIDMHCGTGTGFRFALDGPRLLVRHGADDLHVHAQALAGMADPFVLFLGAGFAASSNMPLGNRIRDDAIRRLLGIEAKDPMTSKDLAQRFHDWIAEKSDWMNTAEQELSPEKYITHLTLEQVVRAENRVAPNSFPTLTAFKDHHDRVLAAPGQAVQDLCVLLSSPQQRPIVVEINFDLLVETHCSADLRVFASEEEFENAADYLDRYLAGDEDAIPVLKLHGSIDRLETCVVSTAQTEGGVGQGKLEALRRLRGTNGPRKWLYVGTSMRDLDLRGVLREEDFARNVDEQWVEPYLSPGVEEFGRDRDPYWRKTQRPTIQDRLITETADAFFAAVRTALPK